jgi:hypothetical protein
MAVLLTPTMPKRTNETSERRRTSAEKLDEPAVGGVEGGLISAETGPFCRNDRKS